MDNMGTIQIFYQSRLKHSIKVKEIKQLIKKIFVLENKTFKSINIIFCSDEYLLKINTDFLNHDYYTDVITFNYSSTLIEGEIYISGERLEENARLLNVSLKKETLRVIIHGILHLCGYSDGSTKEKIIMTLRENFYIINNI